MSEIMSCFCCHEEVRSPSEVASTYEKVLEWSRSLALLRHLKSAYVTLDTIGCNAAIGACQRLAWADNAEMPKLVFPSKEGLGMAPSGECPALHARQQVLEVLWFL